MQKVQYFENLKFKNFYVLGFENFRFFEIFE